MHSHPLSSKRSPSFPVCPIHASVPIAPNRWYQVLKNEIKPCPWENDILYPERRATQHSTMTSRDVLQFRDYERLCAASASRRPHPVNIPLTTACQNAIPVLRRLCTHAVSFDQFCGVLGRSAWENEKWESLLRSLRPQNKSGAIFASV